MKKQAYKIEKMDWMVSYMSGRQVRYFWFATKKEAVEFMKEEKGNCQLFKVSYEFRDVMG